MPIIDGLVTLTVTPGSTALLVSATLPLIDPVVLAPPPCANAVDASRHPASTAKTRWNPRHFIELPPQMPAELPASRRRKRMQQVFCDSVQWPDAKRFQ